MLRFRVHAGRNHGPLGLGTAAALTPRRVGPMAAPLRGSLRSPLRGSLRSLLGVSQEIEQVFDIDSHVSTPVVWHPQPGNWDSINVRR